MTRYTIIPHGRRFELIDEKGAPIEVEAIGEQGGFALNGRRYALSREAGWGDFMLHGGGGVEGNEGPVLARATKRSALSRTFDVLIGAQALELVPTSSVRDSFRLECEGESLLAFREYGFFRSRFEVTQTISVQPEVRCFIAWLVVLMWRRSQHASTPMVG